MSDIYTDTYQEIEGILNQYEVIPVEDDNTSGGVDEDE